MRQVTDVETFVATHDLENLHRITGEVTWHTETVHVDTLTSMYPEIYPYRDTMGVRHVDIDLTGVQDPRIVQRRPDKRILVWRTPIGVVVVDGNHRVLNACYWNEPTIDALAAKPVTQ